MIKVEYCQEEYIYEDGVWRGTDEWHVKMFNLLKEELLGEVGYDKGPPGEEKIVNVLKKHMETFWTPNDPFVIVEMSFPGYDEFMDDMKDKDIVF